MRQSGLELAAAFDERPIDMYTLRVIIRLARHTENTVNPASQLSTLYLSRAARVKAFGVEASEDSKTNQSS